MLAVGVQLPAVAADAWVPFDASAGVASSNTTVEVAASDLTLTRPG
jgi:hypothetical protein